MFMTKIILRYKYNVHLICNNIFIFYNNFQNIKNLMY